MEADNKNLEPVSGERLWTLLQEIKKIYPDVNSELSEKGFRIPDHYTVYKLCECGQRNCSYNHTCVGCDRKFNQS